MSTPTSGPESPAPKPNIPAPKSPAASPKSLNLSNPAGSGESAFLLHSPFAKMFTAHGGQVNAREMKMIMDNILKSVISNMKRDQAEAKKAAEHLKKVIKGEDD